MINILIAGYHGFGNCGDEATLQAMTVNIRDMASDVRITALSYKPELTKTEYNIESVQRFNALQVLNAIRHSDIILSGGGTLLQDGTSTRSLLYYLSIIRIAKLFRKRVMLYANGIGPVNGRFNRKLIKLVVNKADIITLREHMSQKDLKEIGVSKPDIFVTADPAFTLKAVSDEAASRFLELEGVPRDKDIVGVSVRSWTKAKGGESYIKELAAVCDRLVKDGKTVLLIPMQFPRDVDISLRLMGQMSERAYILDKEYTPAEILGIIGQVKVMLSMRLHTLIFAAVKRVPMVGIVYDPKVEYYLKLLNMPVGGDVRREVIDRDKISAKINGVFNDFDKYRRKLDSKVKVLENKARENDRFLEKQLDIIRKKKKRKEK